MTPGAIYRAVARIVPATTLTDGTAYLNLRNTHASRRALMRKIRAQKSFNGTPAESQSIFGLSKSRGNAPDATSTTVIKVVQANSKFDEVATIITSALYKADGLDLTTPTPDMTVDGPFMHFVIDNEDDSTGAATPRIEEHLFEQTTKGADKWKEFDLAPGEGVCVVAVGTIVAGAALSLEFTWEEYDS
jgi:hypothetical protein